MLSWNIWVPLSYIFPISISGKLKYLVTNMPLIMFLEYFFLLLQNPLPPFSSNFTIVDWTELYSIMHCPNYQCVVKCSIIHYHPQYCCTLHTTSLFYTTLHFTVPHYSTIHYTIVYKNAIQFHTVQCRALLFSIPHYQTLQPHNRRDHFHLPQAGLTLHLQI